MITIATNRKGTNGVSTDGVGAIFSCFLSGTFWVSPLTYFYSPKSARAYLFPLSVKINYLCSSPMSVHHIYIYIYMYVCICVYIYIYI